MNAARANMTAAARGRQAAGVDGGRAAPRASAVRTRPVRITIDLDPADHRKLKAWAAQLAAELDQPRLSLADVIRGVIRALDDPAAEEHIRNAAMP